MLDFQIIPDSICKYLADKKESITQKTDLNNLRIRVWN